MAVGVCSGVAVGNIVDSSFGVAVRLLTAGCMILQAIIPRNIRRDLITRTILGDSISIHSTHGEARNKMCPLQILYMVYQGNSASG